MPFPDRFSKMRYMLRTYNESSCACPHHLQEKCQFNFQVINIYLLSWRGFVGFLSVHLTYVHPCCSLVKDWSLESWGMYVCVYRGCPSWSAHGKERPTGPGGGALKGFKVPTPRVPLVPRYACWLILAQSTFRSQLYSGQLRVICILI